MAKDDYDVVVYRVLVYLYAVLKHKIIFEDAIFRQAVRKNVESDEYFTSILRMMQEENLIEGLQFSETWGGDCILISELSKARITANGIHYLRENNMMNKVGSVLKESADIIASLASHIGLFL